MAAASAPVPITMGSARFRSVEADAFRVTDAWFPPGAVLETHTHDRATFAVMLAGGFDLVFGHTPHECPAGTVFTEPIGEPHANRITGGGAHVVVLQPDPSREELLEPVQRVLEGIHLFRHPTLVRLAGEAGREVRAGAPAASLAVESLALEMLCTAARLGPERPVRARTQPWLRQAREYVHAHFREGLTLARVADTVGVHPARLARGFRRQYGLSLPCYVRELRMEWATAEVLRSEGPLAAVAAAAGFADQSHFTRAFREYHGRTPAEYRRQR